MSDNKEYITKSDESGSVNISEDVIAIIALEAIARVEGVGGLRAHHNKDISEILGKKGAHRGIKVQVADSDITVEAYVMVKYGFAVNEVAKKIQNDVSEAVESMTGLSVSAVNIHVSGISFDKEK